MDYIVFDETNEQIDGMEITYCLPMIAVLEINLYPFQMIKTKISRFSKCKNIAHFDNWDDAFQELRSRESKVKGE